MELFFLCQNQSIIFIDKIATFWIVQNKKWERRVI